MSGIKPTEAHRRHMVQGNEKKERTYPFAGDTDNDATYDPEEEAEEAPAAGPSVASSAQSQSDLSSLIIRPTALSVVSQMAALSTGGPPGLRG